MNCSFCDRKAFADAEIPSLGSTWLYVCKSHFITEGCSFREGKAELLISEAPYFNDDVSQDYETFIKEIETCQI